MEKKQITLPPEEKKGPSPIVIAEKKRIAELFAKTACPHCWKNGASSTVMRFEEHRRRSCLNKETTDSKKGKVMEGMTNSNSNKAYCDVCEISIDQSQLQSHQGGKKHMRNVIQYQKQ